MAHVVEQAAILSAVLVDKSHRWGSGAHAGHGDTSFWRSHPAYTVPNMTDEGLGGRESALAMAGTRCQDIRAQPQHCLVQAACLAHDNVAQQHPLRRPRLATCQQDVRGAASERWAC